MAKSKKDTADRTLLTNSEASLARRWVILPWLGEHRELQAVLRSLIDNKRLQLGEVADMCGVPHSYLSRWLTDHLQKDKAKRHRIPLGVLDTVAEKVGRRLVVTLVRDDLVNADRRHSTGRNKLQAFYMGMAYLNHAEGPVAVARLIADVWEAKSWCLYKEYPGKNMLIWIGDEESVQYKAFMYGPSWSNERPIRVVQTSEVYRPAFWQSPPVTHNWPDELPPNQEPYADAEPHRVDSLSTFAVRERVKSFISLAVHVPDERWAVLFLNFDRSLKDLTADEIEELRVARSELRTAVERAWGSSATVSRHTSVVGHAPVRQTGENSWTIHRGQAGIGPVLGVLHEAARDRPWNEKSKSIAGSFEDVAGSLWPGRSKFCRSFVPKNGERGLVIRTKEAWARELVQPLSEDEADRADSLIRRTVASGEGYFITNLNSGDSRKKYDDKHELPLDQDQKIVVPIRCETFLDGTKGKKLWLARWRSEGNLGEDPTQDSHVVVHCGSVEATPHDNKPDHRADDPAVVMCWGAVSIDASEPILSQAQYLELSVLSHLVAETLYVQDFIKSRPKGELRSSLETLFAIFRSILSDMIKGQAERAPNFPFAEFCKRILHAASDTGKDHPLFATRSRGGTRILVNRVEIYPFDHVREEFPQRLRGIQSRKPDDKSSSKKEGAQHEVQVRPRKGGNSERLLGIADEYHVICDADNHPRVNPVTKIDGIHGLVGCACRCGLSFRGDAVIWLGYGDKLPTDLFGKLPKRADAKNPLEASDYFISLRLFAHLVGLLTVAVRWWGTWEDDPQATDKRESYR